MKKIILWLQNVQHYLHFKAGVTLKLMFQVYSKIQKFSKKREIGPQVARANLGGPALQLFKDKINIITVITIKQIEVRGGRGITSNRHKKLKKKKSKN